MTEENTTEVHAPVRRRLTDLYSFGRDETFSDGQGDVTVYLSKLSPLEMKRSAEKANASRASMLALKHLPNDHEDRLPYVDKVEDLELNDRDRLIDFLVAPKVQESFQSHLAQIASEDKWSKDDYLLSLQDVWNDGIKDTYALDPDNVEAKRVFNALTEYSEAVDSAVAADRDDYVNDLNDLPSVELRSRAVDRIIETEADYAWLEEFRKQQLFYSVRVPEDHRERYFLSRDEIDTLDDKVFNDLMGRFLEMTIDPLEGKDSEETPLS